MNLLPAGWRLPRLLRDASWISVASSAPQLVRGSVFLVLAPLLGPEAYGLMGLAAMVEALAGLVLRDGWSTALLRLHALSDAMLSSCFWMLALLSLAAVPLILGGGYLLGWTFGEPLLPVIVAALLPALLAEALEVPARAWLLHNGRSHSVALVSSAASVAAGASAVAAALAGLGVWSLVLFSLVLAVTRGIMLSLQSGWRPKVHFIPGEMRGIVGFAARIGAANAIIVLEQVALRSFVTGLFGTGGLGSLMLARRVVELIAGTSSMALGRASLIGLARHPPGSHERRRTLLQALRFGLLLGLPAAAFLAVGAEPAVFWLAGTSWLQSVPLIEASALLVPALPLNAILAQWHYSHDRAGRELRLRMLGTLLLLLFLPLVLVTGLAGVVLAMACRSWILLSCRLFLVFRHPTFLPAAQSAHGKAVVRPRV